MLLWTLTLKLYEWYPATAVFQCGCSDAGSKLGPETPSGGDFKPMHEQELRNFIQDVQEGTLSRRDFIRRMMAAGLTAPLATQLLAYCGVAMAQYRFAYAPTRRGGGGTIKLLYWQGPTLLNPHFAIGTKDQEASRIFYEPLAGWSGEGELVPILAAELPARDNGCLAADGRSVIWKLKQGVKWHDGEPFTADDAVFTWEFAKDPATAATSVGIYRDIEVEKIDQYTIKVNFPKPTPFWALPFVGTFGMIIPKHLFEPFRGAKSREAPTNLSPVGTGPYKFADFKPGDFIKGTINPNYHVPNRPYFDTIELKGGGDAVSAARAVIQTGEHDFAWNLQVEDEILSKLEQGGKGAAVVLPGGNMEHLQVNPTDPWTEVDGERSSIKSTHPVLSDPAVRRALGLLVDKNSVQKFIYGRGGVATPNFLNNPEQFRSKATKFEFNIAEANRILDEAGWVKGSDGIRAKGEKKIKLVFQTSINAPRQKTQAIIKQACQKAGIDVELKSVTGSVYFSSDLANPDTYSKFVADLQMYMITMTEPDPGNFMRQFVSSEIASKSNKWQSRNVSRWHSDEYDAAYQAAESELDPVKRAALFIKMNELAIEGGNVIPIVYRPFIAGLASSIRAPLSGWDNQVWMISDWYRVA
jgi:peptide/nickel transport system substrate-binding protein